MRKPFYLFSSLLALIIYSIIVLRAIFPISRSITTAILLNYKLEDEIIECKKVEEKLRELNKAKKAGRNNVKVYTQREFI